MKLEDFLGEIIASRSNARQQIQESVSNCVEKAVYLFGYLAKPFAPTIEKIMDSLYFNPEEI